MDIEKTLRALSATIQKIEIKATRDNMDKLLGCLMAIDDAIKEVKKQNANPENHPEGRD